MALELHHCDSTKPVTPWPMRAGLCWRASLQKKSGDSISCKVQQPSLPQCLVWQRWRQGKRKTKITFSEHSLISGNLTFPQGLLKKTAIAWYNSGCWENLLGHDARLFSSLPLDVSLSLPLVTQGGTMPIWCSRVIPTTYKITQEVVGKTEN